MLIRPSLLVTLVAAVVSCGRSRESGSNSEIRPATGDECPLRIVTITKPTPLCGSYGESPAWMNGKFQQLWMQCPGRSETMTNESFIECDDRT